LGIAALSPAGKTLATCDEEGVLQLWETETGKEFAALRGRPRVPSRLTFGPGGKVLASSKGWDVSLWDVGTGEERHIGRSAWTVNTLVFSADGQKLASGDTDGVVVLWDVAQGKELVRFRGGVGNPRGMAFSPDGKTLVLTGGSNAGSRTDVKIQRCHLELWQFPMHKHPVRLEGHTHYVNAVTYSPDGKMLASVSIDRTVRLWEVATGKQRALLRGFAQEPSCLEFSPDGKLLAVGAGTLSEGELTVWDLATNQRLAHIFEGIKGPITELVFSARRSLRSLSSDWKVATWNPVTGANLARWKPVHTVLASSAFTHDGKRLAWGLRNGQISAHPWQEADDEVRLNGHDGPVRALVFSADGKTLASASDDRSVRLWDVTNRRALRTLRGHASEVLAVAFRPDGRMLASAGEDGIILLWELPAGKAVHRLKGHAGPVRCLSFSEDGRTLASGGDDRVVRLWDPATGKERARLEGGAVALYCLALSGDGKRLAAGGGRAGAKGAGAIGETRVWDLGTGKQCAFFSGHKSLVRFVAFSRDGRLLAEGDPEQALRVWEVATVLSRSPKN
jgi:WD40 repeat protein